MAQTESPQCSPIDQGASPLMNLIYDNICLPPFVFPNPFLTDPMFFKDMSESETKWQDKEVNEIRLRSGEKAKVE